MYRTHNREHCFPSLFLGDFDEVLFLVWVSFVLRHLCPVHEVKARIFRFADDVGSHRKEICSKHKMAHGS